MKFYPSGYLRFGLEFLKTSPESLPWSESQGESILPVSPRMWST